MADDDRRTAWLAARREVVTSTGLAALMHLPDAYGSPMSEWLEKMGRAERGEETPEWMVWGQKLQQAILVGYAEAEGQPIELVDEYELVRSQTCERLGASLDARWQSGDRRPVDAKNIGYADPAEWGEPYTDEIPPRFVVQLHGQMEVLGAPVADLAVLFGGRRLVIYRVERDEEIIAACREVAVSFWEKHVIPDIPPPVDGSDEWTRFLKSRRQRFEAYLDAKSMSPEVLAIAADTVSMLAAAKEAKTDSEEDEALYGNRLRALIGEHAGLIVPGYRVHWKQNKSSKVTDWEAIAKYLAGRISELDGPAGSRYLPEAIERFTTEKPGNRPLILKTAKEAKQS